MFNTRAVWRVAFSVNALALTTSCCEGDDKGKPARTWGQYFGVSSVPKTEVPVEVTKIGEKAKVVLKDDVLAQFKKMSETFVSPEELEDMSRHINKTLHDPKLMNDLKEAVPVLKEVWPEMPMGEIGYGFIMGYSSGFCIKKFSKVAAFGVGGIFILVQTLSYNGYATINQDKISDDVKDILDLNHDGMVDEKDVQIAFDKVETMLSYSMPAGGGFTSGLVIGLRA